MSLTAQCVVVPPYGGDSSFADSYAAYLGFPYGVSHPLLRTHPETGKTAFYIHGGFLRQDSLYVRRNVCRFKWQPGSIAFGHGA